MNVTSVTTSTDASQQTLESINTNTKTYKIELIDDGNISIPSDDDDDDLISSDGSVYDDNDLAQIAVQDDLANQLAAAGPVGVAAAAAIASSKKRKRHHSFETNPSVRKRQQNRLLRKMRAIIYEFTGRVGKQAVVLVATPGKPNTSYKVFGAKPLEDVIRNLKNIVMDELENALAQQAPPPPQEDPSLFELPPLIIDGIPTPVEKMTQAQLRAFIPLMLKYSTGRGKPGWGRESTRPPWWPKELPWANVRMDARSEDDKQKISWTHALRKIVINCYKYHGREDLLPTFADEDEKINNMISQEDEEEEDEVLVQHSTMNNNNNSSLTTQIISNNNNPPLSTSLNQQVNVVKINSSGTVITTHTTNSQNPNNPGPTIIQSTNDQHITTTATLPASTKIELCPGPPVQVSQNQQQQQQQHQSHTLTQASNLTNIPCTTAQTIANAQVCIEPMTIGDVDYTTQTVLSTIQNADGTVSLIQVDPNNPIITLPDGTTAQVQGVATLHQGEGGATIQTVQSLADVNGHENMAVDLTEATIGQDGQIFITTEDGQGYPVSVGNMITVPVSASMYQSMMANIQQIHTNSDGTVCITPMQVDTTSSNCHDIHNIRRGDDDSSDNSNNSNVSLMNDRNNNNTNGLNQFQCYSILARTPIKAAATQRLFAMQTSCSSSSTLLQGCGLTNMNIKNFNDNSNANSLNHNCSSVKRQLVHGSLIGENMTQNRQTLLQNTINTARIVSTNNASQLNMVAGSILLNKYNNNDIVIVNNNNNATNCVKVKHGIPSTISIPLVVTDTLHEHTERRSSSGNVVDNSSSDTNKKSQKRRKQNFAKILAVKLGDVSSIGCKKLRPASASNNMSKNNFVDTRLVKITENSAVNVSPLPTNCPLSNCNIIKLETFNN